MNPNQPVTYQDTFTFSQAGSYSFSPAYRDLNGVWKIGLLHEIPKDSGVIDLVTFNITLVGCASVPIGYGQPINGSLATNDRRSPVRGNTYYADRYSFNASAGQQVAILLTSSPFDTYLYLIAPNGSLLAENDDGGGGTNSRIPATAGLLSLTVGDTYTIEVTSFAANATGSYNLTLFGYDTDGDGIPDAVELSEGTNPLVKDNDIFNDARLFAMQQYRDYLGREGEPAGIAYWTNQVASGLQTRAQAVEAR